MDNSILEPSKKGCGARVSEHTPSPHVPKVQKARTPRRHSRPTTRVPSMSLSISAERARVAESLCESIDSFLDEIVATFDKWSAQVGGDNDGWGWDAHVMKDLTHITGHDDESFCTLSVGHVAETIEGFRRKTPERGDPDFVSFFVHALSLIEALKTNDSYDIVHRFRRCNAIWEAQIRGDLWAFDQTPSGAWLMREVLSETIRLPELRSHWDDGDDGAGYSGDSREYYGYVRPNHKRRWEEDW